MPKPPLVVRVTSHDYEFHYRIDGDRVRVWKPTWFGDQFEVVARDDFMHWKVMAEQLGVTFVEHYDDD